MENLLELLHLLVNHKYQIRVNCEFTEPNLIIK